MKERLESRMELERSEMNQTMRTRILEVTDRDFGLDTAGKKPKIV